MPLPAIAAAAGLSIGSKFLGQVFGEKRPVGVYNYQSYRSLKAVNLSGAQFYQSLPAILEDGSGTYGGTASAAIDIPPRHRPLPPHRDRRPRPRDHLQGPRGRLLEPDPPHRGRPHVTTATIDATARKVPPYGMAGGEPGALGRTYVERTSGEVDELAGADSADLHPGDVLVVETPGGGGYGSPG